MTHVPSPILITHSVLPCLPAAAPLLVIIRDNLNLTKQDLSAGNIASVSGAIFSRILMGVICDTFGPRYGHGFLQLLTSSATFCMAVVPNAGAFITVRMVIGFSLATFVACQFWISTMFNVRIVGTANGLGAGWGNAGAGITYLVMPAIYNGLCHLHPNFIAWRVAFWIPAFAQIVIGMACLIFGIDAPDGNYADLRKSGLMLRRPKTNMDVWAALKNYRTWIMVLTYGYCFGVELTVDNNIAGYLHDNFNMSLTKAANVGAIFMLANFITRPSGGFISDTIARRFGMRGRLWFLWSVQTMGGVCSCLMYVARNSMGGTIAVIVMWSIFIPVSCGATFGVAPFITRRGLGTATGLIGSGGNAGSAITQAIFFTASSMTLSDGFLWMGVMIIGMTTLVATIHFPMWGSMFFPGNPDVTEEEYYTKDFSKAEQEQGLHRAILNFASESRSQRGFKNQGLSSESSPKAKDAGEEV